MAHLRFDEAIEAATGKTTEELRRASLEDIRAEAVARNGGPLRFVSRFPEIGRGNVLAGRAVSHEDAEKAFQHAIRRW